MSVEKEIMNAMWEVAERFRVRVGSVTYTNVPNLIVFRGESLFTLKRHEDGYLGIYFDIYSADGDRVAAVRRNEVYLGDQDAYQVDGSANRYVVTERASGRVLCDLRKREDAQPVELDLSVHLYTPSGFLFDATPERTNLPAQGIVFQGGAITDCANGIVIE